MGTSPEFAAFGTSIRFPPNAFAACIVVDISEPWVLKVNFIYLVCFNQIPTGF
jgi:hypothetical protein